MYRCALLTLTLIVSGFAAPTEDLVNDLPGLNFQPAFEHYSGYVNVSSTKFFHYWFTKAYSNPDTSPVILWLNGGPGCSSVVGLIEELGPFHVKDNGQTVYENPYSWNHVGNVIFLESPAGVGFSYASDSDPLASDETVAEDNYQALLYFFKYKFPEYRDNDFYITGESYSGIYIPMLAVKVAAKPNFPAFKGVAIGNGIYSFPLNYNTMVPLFYYHGLVRNSLYSDVATTCCNGNTYNCDYYTLLHSETECSDKIKLLLQQGADLDPYNLYSTCYLDNGATSQRNFIRNALFRKSNLKGLDNSIGSGLPLCAQSNNTEIYLNRADVRNALHIPDSVGHWTECSNDVALYYQYTHNDVSKEFHTLLGNIRILTYNGDVDTVCNLAMNMEFVASLGLSIKDGSENSAEWYYNYETPRVAGFVTKYTQNLDFVTVRGSGHFVPQDKPREALQLIYNFIHNRDYSLPIPFQVRRAVL
uniref:Carboxypeptidase n=1 Tax=Panagrellus redivivus TaxID=6233 RepID=A0A7E4W4E3_PANRE